MVRRQLPARPHLGHLRKQAKELAKAYRAGDPEAVGRVTDLLPGPAGRPLSLSLAQLAVARDYGFDSWPKLKLHVEAGAQSFDEKLARFIAAACSNRLYQAKQLLALEPRLARHNLVTAAIVGDAECVAALLAANPDLARAPTGPYQSEPLGYLAFSRFHRESAAHAAGMLAIARQLLALGGNPNGVYHYPGAGTGEDPRVSVLYGAAANADHFALAEILLDSGADPNDRESLYHAAELPSHATLRLLLAHGAEISGSGVLKRKLDFDDLEGVKLLLEHGADPNEEGVSRGGALHHAIRRGRSAETVALLLEYGAKIDSVDGDGRTPYQVALRSGDAAIVSLLESRGAPKGASPSEVLLTACAGADLAAAKAVLASHPTLPKSLPPADMKLMSEFAQRDLVHAIRTMLDCGFALETKGDWGGTALHHAAYHGAINAVALLIGRGADLECLNDYGGTVLGAALYGSANCWNPVGDYAQVVELLLEAGSKVLPHMLGLGSEAADEVLRTFGE